MHPTTENRFSILYQGMFKDFLELIRLKFHLNFGFVILGAVSFAKQIDVALIFSILVMYLSFNVCLYGGLYTINAITDLEKDAKHPLKKNRPLPSKRISKTTAIILAAVLISLGLLVGFLYFGQNIGLIYITFIVINLFYSFFARNIPYLELFVNASTMPVRLLMGTFIVMNGTFPTLLMLGAFCTGIGFLSVRRIVEKDIDNWKEARPALKAYQGNIMLWLQILAFVVLIMAFKFDPFIQQDLIAYIFMGIYYLIFCFGTHLLPPIRNYWKQYYGH
ncbi:MAG: UbiA family prenyltransferase [Nostocaceae cyanobacterium]|nr:UbiA family prenyltransferase [Nostocaceae cyanobacterium]